MHQSTCLLYSISEMPLVLCGQNKYQAKLEKLSAQIAVLKEIQNKIYPCQIMVGLDQCNTFIVRGISQVK